MSPGSNQIKDSQWSLQYKEHSSYFVYDKAKIKFIKIGKGEPLILIHGGGSWSYSFRNNIIPLSKYFTVYAIDFPGHGYSEIPTNFDYTVKNISNLLLEFLKYNNIDKTNLIGNSWGGGWAIYFAEKNPNKVINLVLIDSAGIAHAGGHSTWDYLTYPCGEIILYFVTKINVKDAYENELYYNKKLVTEDMVNEIWEPFHYKENLLAQQKYQKNLNWAETENNLNMLKNVIIIWGRYDPYVPVSTVEQFKKQIPSAKVFIFDSARHLPHEEKYNEVNKIIIDELKK